jgi:hypothetical protein
MRDVLALFTHVTLTLFRFCRPGGVRAVMAESLLLRHQLLILTRGRQRAPNLRPADRVIAGACALCMRPGRVLRTAIVLKPSTVLACHRALVRCKYRWLFTPKRRGRPGPQGPSAAVVAAIVEMKRRNSRWGCPRIAQQIALAFGIEIDKDVVRRVLARHYRPESGGGGPSWLTFIGHMKDSLWSVDLFRCESLTLRSHWVLLVMDQHTRRIVGCGVHAGILDGVAVCRMFNSVIVGQVLPRYLSSDHDPLFECHRWRANLRVLRSRKSRPSRMCHSLIPSWSGLSAPSDASISTRCRSGVLLISSENGPSSRRSTTLTGHTPPSAGKRLHVERVNPRESRFPSTTLAGSRTAANCFKPRCQCELGIRQAQALN